ncbi:MAG: response regulator [Armatimonadetes bacterium]|nr:response regulator [Armatimonadota bacterium]
METTSRTVRVGDVLVVEDNEDHFLLVMEAFESAGIKNPVYRATTTAQAREYVAGLAQRDGGNLPCVILLDVHLPDGSGLDLLSEIKQDPSLKSVPVVMLTTTEDASVVNAAYQRGANSYLVKPVRAADFHRTVREAGLYWLLLNEAPRA